MKRNRLVEDASLNAWPALNSLLYDGWVLRFAKGYTKRANSITPLYAGEVGLEAKIDFCEEQYRQLGLPPIFRLAEANEIGGLDEVLAARGFGQLDITSVQGRALGQQFQQTQKVSVLDGDGGLAAWLKVFHALNPGRGDSITHEAIVRRIVGRICPMVLSEQGEAVGCGLGVLQGGTFGLFDIVTAEAQRRKGYGREVTESLLAWGAEQGARTAYLQVMISNRAAQNLYAQFGFEELYRYWYRVAADN